MKTKRFFNEQLNILRMRDIRVQIATRTGNAQTRQKNACKWDFLTSGADEYSSQSFYHLREENRRLMRQINELIQENRALTWIIEKRR